MLDKFLKAYRELEQALKEDSLSVLEFENSLNEIDREKLKVCRIIRNYASHNDVNFVTCTKEQISFLEDLRLFYLQDKDIVGSCYTKLPLTQNKMQDVIKAVQKRKYARTEVGMINAELCIKNYGKRKFTEALQLPKVDVSVRISDINFELNEVYEVINKNKTVGIITRKK